MDISYTDNKSYPTLFQKLHNRKGLPNSFSQVTLEKELPKSFSQVTLTKMITQPFFITGIASKGYPTFSQKLHGHQGLANSLSQNTLPTNLPNFFSQVTLSTKATQLFFTSYIIKWGYPPLFFKRYTSNNGYPIFLHQL